eukprot:TRINITY_DN1698_c1_g2_i1.p1 TRINITY_DN1698_c1_g2~~TRINITY_DN1698_c1_g2_i1.p1  ORF type:complete len:494 (+),score=78.93 TRINITY_DN1698_c1_g2_i1:54-1535(+)
MAPTRIFCTTPEGIEFILKKEIEEVVEDDLFLGFDEEEPPPGIVLFTLKETTPDRLKRCLDNLQKLRSTDYVCSLVLCSGDTYPLNSIDELQEMEKEAASQSWDEAIRVWRITHDITEPDLTKAALFRCTGKRLGRGMRSQKPKYKSPDVERSIGKVFSEKFGTKASMVLHNLQVLIVHSSEKVVIGICTHKPNALRLGHDFQQKSRDDRNFQEYKVVYNDAWERFNKQLKLSSQLEGMREKILRLNESGKMSGSDLKPGRNKNDTRVCMSENSMSVTIAHALVALSDIKDGDVVCDPMSGSGTTLLETCAMHANCTAVLGGDFTMAECVVSAVNCDSFHKVASAYGVIDTSPSITSDKKRICADTEQSLPSNSAQGLDTCNWNAMQLPLRSSSIDVIMSDFPFGNRCGSSCKNAKLYPAVLSEIARILRPGGTATFLVVARKLMDALLKEEVTASYFNSTRVPFKLNMGDLWPFVYCLKRTDVAWVKPVVQT